MTRQERLVFNEMVALLTKIDVSRKSPTGIGDTLGGLGDWLEDVLIRADKCREERGER